MICYKQWETQITILSVSETNYKIKNASERNIKMYFQEQSPIIQAVHSKALSKVPTTLTIK